MSISAPGPSSSRPRIHVLDFIRLVAMLLMIQGHTLDAFANPAHMDLDAFHWQAWVHLRGLTAPLFLMVSGAASVLGIRHEADGRISRTLLRRRVTMAFTVIGIGYLMVFPANRLVDLRWVSADIWRGFLQVNILQLNGATLLLLTGLLALTRSVRRYAAWSLGLGCLILLLAPFAFAVDWFRWLPEGLAAYLSFGHGSLFPLFPASAYMFLGVGLGALLLETPEGRRARTFRLACLAASAALLLLGLAAEHLPARLFPSHDAYKAGYSYLLLRLGFALLVFGVLAWIAELRPRLAAACAPMGRKSLYVYVGHLVLIYGTPWTPGLATGQVHALSLGDAAAFIPLVGTLTFGTLLVWDWVRTRSETLGTLVHASAVCALTYALVF
jgi:uncharacterized membrane protein